MLPSRNQHGRAGSAQRGSSRARCGTAAGSYVLRRRPRPPKGHEARRGETLAKTAAALSAATHSQIRRGCCTALISSHEFKVSLDALTENRHCPRPAVSTTSNGASQLLAVILFIIAGPRDKQKRSPIVLSVVQKSLISLFVGCSLELFLNKIFSNINKFKFQNSRNPFPEMCFRKQLKQLCLSKF